MSRPPRIRCAPLGINPGAGIAALLLVALLATGCGDLPTTPAPSADPPVSLELDAQDLALEAIGQTRTMAVDLRDAAGRPAGAVALEWTSDAPDVVTVDAQGRIEARANGVALIHVRTASSGGVASGTGDPTYQGGQLAASVEVRVHQRVATIEVSSPTPRLQMIGELVQLETRVLDPLGSPLERDVTLVWRSGVESILAVGESGRVQALADGSGRVLAEAEEVTGELDLMVDARVFVSACVVRGVANVQEARSRGAAGESDACSSSSILRRAQP